MKVDLDKKSLARAMKEITSVNVARMRYEHGWTQENLAEFSGLSRVTIGNIESRSTLVSLSSLRLLAYAFECSLDDLCPLAFLD